MRWSADFAGRESSGGGEPLTTVQAILFGMMLSWTPSAALLVWFFWKERIGLDHGS
jgi:hypothetical protein